MATELRAAGATELIKRLPQNWISSHFWASKDDVADVIAALQHYKEGIQTGLEKTTSKTASDAEGGAGDEGDEPMEGDVVDGYKFKGGDPSVQSNWEPVVEKKP